MKLSRLFFAGALVAGLGCSGETVPDPIDVTGTWRFTFSASSISGVMCTSTMNIYISQDGERFTGTQQGAGTLSCIGADPAVARPNPFDLAEFDNDGLSDGLTSDDQVVFSTNAFLTTNTGVVDTKEHTMAGTTTWQLPVKPHGTVQVTGSWTAVKQ